MKSQAHFPPLTCLPIGICAWSFRIADEENVLVAKLSFVGLFGRPVFTYQGSFYSILDDHSFFKVRSGAFFSSFETIEGSEPVAVAHRPFSSQGDYEIKAGTDEFIMQESGTGFEILLEDRVLGTVKRVHRNTKRTILACDPAVDILIQLFCLGLALGRWRHESDAD